MKASYSSISDNPYLSNEAIGSVTRDKLAAKTCLPWVSGTNGASSNLCSTELRILDAVDDEYGGVLVNPEKLPANPDAFAYILHSSLSYWKVTVILIICFSNVKNIQLSDIYNQSHLERLLII